MATVLNWNIKTVDHFKINLPLKIWWNINTQAFSKPLSSGPKTSLRQVDVENK